MGRHHVKEFRPDEALGLISADREGKALACPSCGAVAVARCPPRAADGAPAGRITLTCSSCGRAVTYVDRAGSAPATDHAQ